MKYDEILNLPHFHAPGRAYMSNHDRAAQFAPYKSLVGYEELIEEKSEDILAGGNEVIDYSDSQEEFPEDFV